MAPIKYYKIVIKLFILSSLSINCGYCAYGGHDLFTSLAQLKVLWHNELEVVQLMKNIQTDNKNLTIAIKRYESHIINLMPIS